METVATNTRRGGLTPEAAYEIAREAYLYAYPIVLMDLTMRQATHVPDTTTRPLRGPVNQLVHVRAYPPANARDVVRINFDTLYSAAWIDVSREPMVLSVPDTTGRYFVLEMLDMWTDVFATPGTRTTGSSAGSFAIVPPRFAGTVNPELAVIVAPTPLVWLIGRTQTNGPSDYEAVHAIQDGYRLESLSHWRGEPGPMTLAVKPLVADAIVDDDTPPMEQMRRLNGIEVLTRLQALFSKHPPHADDYPMLFRLRSLGIAPGVPFHPASLDRRVREAIDRAAHDAREDIEGAASFGTSVNGWNLATSNIGTYGTSYRQRAIVAYAGLGANCPEDAVYPTAYVDADGKPLHGGHRYEIRFDSRDQLPPADAFWSITLYDQDNYQVPNAIDRYAIGDRDDLHFADDGSLTLTIAHEMPDDGATRANWLPAPQGPFSLTMRIYSPRRSVLEGSWKPPVVRRVT